MMHSVKKELLLLSVGLSMKLQMYLYQVIYFFPRDKIALHFDSPKFCFLFRFTGLLAVFFSSSIYLKEIICLIINS